MSAKVLLVGGPHDGKVIDEDGIAVPGLTIVMSRIPEDGPMVHDLYWCSAEQVEGRPLLAVFQRTRDIPEPDPELLKPGLDEPLAVGDTAGDAPPLDPLIVATANTFRYLAEWFGTEEQRAELYKMAEAVEAATPECDFNCPVCEETTCDETCPLAPVRSRWEREALARYEQERKP